jgi:hypothetical protein
MGHDNAAKWLYFFQLSGPKSDRADYWLRGLRVSDFLQYTW